MDSLGKQPSSKQMPKPQNTQTSNNEEDRVKFLTESHQLAIPVGSRFQAEVPEWTDPAKGGGDEEDESDTLRWLGTKTWPIEGSGSDTEGDKIGKGRPDSCSCAAPGSEECVKLHLHDKRVELEKELGPAFKSWKLDTMGEEAVSQAWSKREQRKFETLVKGNPLSKGKSFLKPAVENLPSKTREDIVNYYSNVFVPRRISKLTRSGCETIDSDDDEPVETMNSKTSRKRCQADSTSPNSKQVKTPFLRGHR